MAQAGGTAPNGVPTVSVVIPTFNRVDRIRDAVDPLLADGAALEVIVVDDGSADGTKHFLESLATTTPGLRCISVENGGAARARQIGVEAAHGDVVLIMDDDVIAAPGLVAGHARLHASRDAVVVVGYMPTERPATGSRGTFATTIYANSYEEHCRTWEADPSAILRVLWMGNISLRREDALRVGMHGTVSGYHADRDFGLRCEKAGLAAVFDRELVASHRHTRTIRQFRSDARSQGSSNFALYGRHGDVLGQYDANVHSSGRLSRWAVAAGQNRMLARPLGDAVSLGIQAAGRLRARTLELRGAFLLSRIEGARGYERAARAAADDRSGS